MQRAYLHIVNRPENGKLRLPLESNRIKNACCVTGEQIKVDIGDTDIVIEIPEMEFDDIVVRIQMENTIVVTEQGIDLTR